MFVDVWIACLVGCKNACSCMCKDRWFVRQARLPGSLPAPSASRVDIISGGSAQRWRAAHGGGAAVRPHAAVAAVSAKSVGDRGRRRPRGAHARGGGQHERAAGGECGAHRDLVVPLLRRVHAPDEVDVRVALNRFDAAHAKCFLKNDEERLLSIVEAGFGSLAPFSALIRCIFRDARATHLEVKIDQLQASNAELQASLSAL